jgi:3-oxoacyl-[acyl-carrier-protein] synthase-3
MPYFSLPNIHLDAIAACVPKQINYVKDYPLFNEQEVKLFHSGTGVYERRFAEKGTCASDLCYAAAKELLAKTNTAIEDIDILIFVTQSPDYILPASSILLQKRLGLSKNTMAFDINLGCSGYVYGLSVISHFLSQPHFKKGLLLCGDVSSTSISESDKSTYPLFGDAGTASLFSNQASKSQMHFNLQSDGGGEQAIIIPGGATRNPFTDDTCTKKVVSPGIERSELDLHLDGVAVFNFALREVKPNMDLLLANSQTEISSIDYLVMHQANKLMNETVRKKMKFPIEKTPYSLEKFGNTSSASIPLTVVTELAHALNGEKKLLLSGFGVGFSWGSCLLTTNNPHICPLIEL